MSNWYPPIELYEFEKRVISPAGFEIECPPYGRVPKLDEIKISAKKIGSIIDKYPVECIKIVFPDTWLIKAARIYSCVYYQCHKRFGMGATSNDEPENIRLKRVALMKKINELHEIEAHKLKQQLIEHLTQWRDDNDLA